MQKIMFDDTYGLTDAVEELTKTVTRRESFCSDEDLDFGTTPDGHLLIVDDDTRELIHKSRYAVGEVVAVAQSYKTLYEEQCEVLGKDSDNCNSYYDMFHKIAGWNNKMFVKPELMPLRIQILNIRFEKLKDISEEDCMKEGICYDDIKDNFYFVQFGENGNKTFTFKNPKDAFLSLIEKMNGTEFVSHNPYNVVYDFKLL